MVNAANVHIVNSINRVKSDMQQLPGMCRFSSPSSMVAGTRVCPLKKVAGHVTHGQFDSKKHRGPKEMPMGPHLCLSTPLPPPLYKAGVSVWVSVRCFKLLSVVSSVLASITTSHVCY